MLENIRLVQKQICDTSDLEAESQRLMDEMNVLSDRVQKCINARHAKTERLGAFVKALAAQDKSITEFDEGLWGTIVDFMTIYSKEDISVTFKDGTEIFLIVHPDSSINLL